MNNELDSMPPAPVGESDPTRAFSLADRYVLAVATGLFLGMVPPRTATLATPLGIPLAMGLYAAFGWVGYLPALLVLWAVGIPLCKRASRILGKKDPREVVYDEYVTLPLIYFGAPPVASGGFPLFDWKVLLAGFALHRFYDILKPLGIDRIERLPGGWGIMCDDILAALLGLLTLQGLLYCDVL